MFRYYSPADWIAVAYYMFLMLTGFLAVAAAAGLFDLFAKKKNLPWYNDPPMDDPYDREDTNYERPDHRQDDRRRADLRTPGQGRRR